jgi:uncharacterized protein YqfB (UPF0267 family)
VKSFQEFLKLVDSRQGKLTIQFEFLPVEPKKELTVSEIIDKNLKKYSGVMEKLATPDAKETTNPNYTDNLIKSLERIVEVKVTPEETRYLNEEFLADRKSKVVKVEKESELQKGDVVDIGLLPDEVEVLEEVEVQEFLEVDINPDKVSSSSLEVLEVVSEEKDVEVIQYITDGDPTKGCRMLEVKKTHKEENTFPFHARQMDAIDALRKSMNLDEKDFNFQVASYSHGKCSTLNEIHPDLVDDFIEFLKDIWRKNKVEELRTPGYVAPDEETGSTDAPRPLSVESEEVVEVSSEPSGPTRFTQEEINKIDRLKLNMNIINEDQLDFFVRQWSPALKGFDDIKSSNLQDFIEFVYNR